MNYLNNTVSNIIFWQFKRSFSETVNYSRKIRQVTKDQIIWYPGHINKGIEQLNQKLVEADAIIEVHDCRIPLSGRTDLMKTYELVKPKILILNKVDLVSKNDINRIEELLKHTSETKNSISTEIIFAQLNNHGRQFKLLEKINESLKSIIDTEFHRNSSNHVLVTGIPNVGKSTFINALRSMNRNKYGFSKDRGSKPASTGAVAGITRSVSHKILISDGPPPLYVLDSPGIWEPSKENIESVLKLALCGCFNFNSVYKELVIDYMLYWLNKNGHLGYVRFYDMSGPTDDVVEFAQRICIQRGFTKKANARITGQKYAADFERAYNAAFDDFNHGLLGRFVLDNMDDYNHERTLYRHRNSLPLGTIIKSNPSSVKQFPFVWAKCIS